MPRRLEPLYTRVMGSHRPSQTEIILRNKVQYVEEPLTQLIFPHGVREDCTHNEETNQNLKFKINIVTLRSALCLCNSFKNTGLWASSSIAAITNYLEWLRNGS